MPVSTAWMQVTKPAEFWKCSCHLHSGKQQRWGTFSPQPHQQEEEPAGFPAEGTAAGTPTIASPASWGGCLAWQEQRGSWRCTSPKHRVCSVCQCHSAEDGVLFLKQLVLMTVEQPQNSLTFSFYSRLSCPQIAVAWQYQKRTCPQFYLIYQTSTILGDWRYNFQSVTNKFFS